MVLWTDLLALALGSIVVLYLLRRLSNRLVVLDSLYRVLQNPIHFRQYQMLRRFQLALKILLPVSWVLILLALVQG